MICASFLLSFPVLAIFVFSGSLLLLLMAGKETTNISNNTNNIHLYNVLQLSKF